jgi:hypothetical protein
VTMPDIGDAYYGWTDTRVSMLDGILSRGEPLARAVAVLCASDIYPVTRDVVLFKAAQLGHIRIEGEPE